MAAARRSSESGVVVGLVICFILMIVGISTGIWFYTRYAATRQAIADHTQAFESNIGKLFTENHWDLPTRQPSEFGEKYDTETFRAVAAKLRSAAEYEGPVTDLLGWDSVTGIRDSLEQSPMQRDLAEQGENAFEEVRGLLDFYGLRYESLTAEARLLREEKQILTDEVSRLNETLREREQTLNRAVADATDKFTADLAALRADYDELVERYDAQQVLTAEWQDKHTTEAGLRRAETRDLGEEIEQWKERFLEATRGPEEIERLEPAGKVITVDITSDVVYIEGGEDEGIHENSTFIVFNRTPDGRDRRKGSIKVGDVYETISRAVVIEEDELFLEGDYFVSADLWDYFYGG
jgi:hypothetical protein